MVFGFTALCSAVFFSSIGFGPEALSSASAADVDLSVTLNPVLSLRVAKDYNDGNGLVDISDLDLSVTPTLEGSFVKNDLSVLVSTSNETGYTLTMSDDDADTTMHHTDTTITDTISSISSPAYESTFPDNSWGYSLGNIASSDQVFDPIPTATTPSVIKVTGNPTTDDTTPVTFAADIDSTIVAGTYVDTVVFSATPNYLPPEQSSVTIAPISTTQIDGGETFTLNTDVDWIDDIGQMIVSLYPAHNVSDTSVCTGPTAVNNNSKLQVTCTSPARAAGVYNVKLELFRFNVDYIADNTITYINPSFNVTITKGTGINQISGTKITATTNTTASGQNQYTTTVTLNATLATGYNTQTWTVTSGGVTLSSTTGGSVTFTMPKEPVAVSVSAKANTYTIKYNGNSSTSGSTANTTATYNAAHTLRANGFARTGYTFQGWSTSSTATSATYTNSQALTAAQVNSLVGSTANGGTINLYAVWKANTFTVKFNANQTGQTIYNTAQAVSGSTANQSYTYGTAQALRANGFSRAGFRFLGWSTNATATTATYTNSQSVSNLTSTNNGTVNLYAIWQPQNQLTTISNMQQMTTAICNATYTPTNAATTANTNQYFSANNAPQRTLTDTRDSKTYIVRKLADGKCWMTQNLRLVGSRTLTSADSDVNSNFILPASTDWPAGADTAASINAKNVHDSGNNNYGAHYNWYTATVGSGTYSITANASYSICPKGWRLPTGGSSTGEIYNLRSKYNNYNKIIEAPSGKLSGSFVGTSAGYGDANGYYLQGLGGFWWSSTAVDNANAYSMNFYSADSPVGAGQVPANSTARKWSGFSVRCVAR